MSSPLEFDTGLRAEELDPERPRPIETPWGTMALYVLTAAEGAQVEVVCSQAFCPHLEGPLFQGTVAVEQVEGEPRHTVTCPWHRWRYDLCDGRRLVPPTGSEPPEDPLVHCRVGRSERGTVLLHRPEA